MIVFKQGPESPGSTSTRNSSDDESEVDGMEFFGTGQAEVLVPAPVPDDDAEMSSSSVGVGQSEGESDADEGGISITVKRSDEDERLSLENLRKNSIVLLVPAAKPGDGDASLAEVTVVPRASNDGTR